MNSLVIIVIEYLIEYYICIMLFIIINVLHLLL